MCEGMCLLKLKNFKWFEKDSITKRHTDIKYNVRDREVLQNVMHVQDRHVRIKCSSTPIFIFIITILHSFCCRFLKLWINNDDVHSRR